MKPFYAILALFVLVNVPVRSQHMKDHHRQKDTTRVENTATVNTVKDSVVATYACPMHSEVVSNQPGKCPKCKMDLVKTEMKKHTKEEAAGYTCPMHSDVKSDKPGKCPKCKMNLVKQTKVQ
jgi:predicted Zn-ribbon and HTH transcriptional regulator